jgi:hypothetical protein
MFPDFSEELSRMCGALPSLPEPQPASIVGWAVFIAGNSIDQAAIYNLEQREQAFAAARRWPASICALVLHPSCPQLPVIEQARSEAVGG